MGIVLFLLTSTFHATAGRQNYYMYDKPQTLENRQTMVHLLEWKWPDIATECETFLQHYGYGAVQVSPPYEHIMITVNGDVPWWVRYQPVSYKLISRSGNEEQFKEMVNRCNKVGVRIVVDVILNHMTSVWHKSGEPGLNTTGGSFFDGTPFAEKYPEVPYTSADFNDFRCNHNITGDDYVSNPAGVRNCRLDALADLNQGSPGVRKKLVAFLDRLIDYGVAGFRFDASKHMWPEDLKAILTATKNLRADIFGPNERPFVVHEVTDRGTFEIVTIDQYVTLGRYTNFNYGAAVSNIARGRGDWSWLANMGSGYGYGNFEDHDVLNFINNHDSQRDDDRWREAVTYKEGDLYRLALAFMLAWPYGYPMVTSSFYFQTRNQGPPHMGANSGYATRSPTFNPDLTCDMSSGWVCEHRWPTTREMAKFRSTVQGTPASEVVTDYQRLAFARHGKGFFAVNGNWNAWSRSFATTMPAGEYCDQYGGSLQNGKCTGRTITVNNNGHAFVHINHNEAVAFSLASRKGELPVVQSAYKKTLIFLRRSTHPTEYVFLRGGNTINHVCAPGPFQQDTDACAIPIIHNTTVPYIYDAYRSWSHGDKYLDFEGDERGQATYNGRKAFGTPLAFSSNDPEVVEYQPHNKYGNDYWMVQLLMDCAKTERGWFDVKGYMSSNNWNGWEPDVKQSKCSGTIGGAAPYSSKNHIAKCGAVNVFSWGSGECVIDSV